MDKLVNNFDEITPEIITHLESEFRSSKTSGPETTFVAGSTPVLIVANHSVKTTTKKQGAIKTKSEEIYTGTIAKLMNQISGCSVIYRNRFESFQIESLAYLLKIYGIKYVIELRGGAENNKYEMIIGANHGEYIDYNMGYITDFAESLQEQNVFDKLPAIDVSPTIKKKHVPKQVADVNKQYGMNVKSVQIMLGRRFRKPKTQFESMIAVIKSLDSYIVKIQRRLLEEERLSLVAANETNIINEDNKFQL